MKLLKIVAMPLIVGAAIVGGTAYLASKNSAKVISMVDAARLWINKRLTKSVPAVQIVDAPAAGEGTVVSEKA